MRLLGFLCSGNKPLSVHFYSLVVSTAESMSREDCGIEAKSFMSWSNFESSVVKGGMSLFHYLSNRSVTSLSKPSFLPDWTKPLTTLLIYLPVKVSNAGFFDFSKNCLSKSSKPTLMTDFTVLSLMSEISSISCSKRFSSNFSSCGNSSLLLLIF